MFSPGKLDLPLAPNTLGMAKNPPKVDTLHDKSNGLDHDVVQIMLKAVANVSPMMKVSESVLTPQSVDCHA